MKPQVVKAKLSEVVVKPVGGLVELGIKGDNAAIVVELTPDQADKLGPILRDAAQEAREM